MSLPQFAGAVTDGARRPGVAADAARAAGLNGRSSEAEQVAFEQSHSTLTWSA
jgi:hypothetical protein